MELRFNNQMLILRLSNVYHSLATTLDTPVQCTAIQSNSSAINSKMFMFFDISETLTTCLLLQLTLYWEVCLIFCITHWMHQRGRILGTLSSVKNVKRKIIIRAVVLNCIVIAQVYLVKWPVSVHIQALYQLNFKVWVKTWAPAFMQFCLQGE